MSEPSRPGPGPAGPSQAQEPSDAELDAYILTRLKLLGVDLSVLPGADEGAPADQARILSSARRFLRSTPAEIHNFEMDPQTVAPGMYPVGTIRGGRPTGDGGDR